MAKPILVINYCVEGMSMGLAVKNLHELQQVVSESNANDEYYTFLLPTTADSAIQVFYDKDLKETQYEELKKMIESKMKSFHEEAKSKTKQERNDETRAEFLLKNESKLTNFFRKIGILPK
jgi:hypothetical protein